MGFRYQNWQARSKVQPKDFASLHSIVHNNRDFSAIDQLNYGDHGLEQALKTILNAIKQNKRIALYADYDVDGTMSCVSWIWFLKSIGYSNYTHYIPDRFTEGYGVNLNAVKHLVSTENAQVIITMDTGITANVEAQWCAQQGVDFICTDHHKIQQEKMPQCIILNPKLHPDPAYQELCGCAITFVLLRKLGQHLKPPAWVWHDILALTGMATICDVVPLNGVNHKLAQLGIQALTRSKRPIFRKLLQAGTEQSKQVNEQDLGFRLGPRINAVGRLEHAHKIIEAFVSEEPDELIKFMGVCNEKRKKIQEQIVQEARDLAKLYPEAPILFLGGDWHQGVVGIAASKIAEEFWKPVWLFDKRGDFCKGSARSIPGFDVTDAMSACSELFLKFGGHKAAGGFSFDKNQEAAIRNALTQFARQFQSQHPNLWQSTISYDCAIPHQLLNLSLMNYLDQMRPFGHEFEEPLFCLEAPINSVQFYKDKQTGKPKHTAVEIKLTSNSRYKIMFFNEVYKDLANEKNARFLVKASRNYWMGQESLSLIGCDYAL